MIVLNHLRGQPRYFVFICQRQPGCDVSAEFAGRFHCEKVDAGVEAGAGCAGSEECGQLPFPAKTVGAVPVPGIFAENSASFHA